MHHFQEPAAVLREMRRVLRPDGRLLLADILTSDDPQKAQLHNDLERQRDPSHVRMLPLGELEGLIRQTGYTIEWTDFWETRRAFGEWAAIVADEARTDPLAVSMRTLADAGEDAGIKLRNTAQGLEFTHRWFFAVAAFA
jgi:SAM-dependent methyltransferase